MKINIQTLNGRIFPLDVESTDMVSTIIERISKTQLISYQYRLIFAGKQLEYTSEHKYIRITDMDEKISMNNSRFKIDSEGHLYMLRFNPSGGKTLSDLCIDSESIIYMVQNLRGGMFHETSGRDDMTLMNSCSIMLPNNTTTTIKHKHNQIITARELLILIRSEFLS